MPDASDVFSTLGQRRKSSGDEERLVSQTPLRVRARLRYQTSFCSARVTLSLAASTIILQLHRLVYLVLLVPVTVLSRVLDGPHYMP